MWKQENVQWCNHYCHRGAPCYFPGIIFAEESNTEKEMAFMENIFPP